MRMTRRVKPPTAAVTITNTWPWSDAMSDAEDCGEWRMVGRREKMWSQTEETWKRRQTRRRAKENCGRRESRGMKREGEIKRKEQVRMIIVRRIGKRNMELMVGMIVEKKEQIFYSKPA